LSLTDREPATIGARKEEEGDLSWLEGTIRKLYSQLRGEEKSGRDRSGERRTLRAKKVS